MTYRKPRIIPVIRRRMSNYERGSKEILAGEGRRPDQRGVKVSQV